MRVLRHPAHGKTHQSRSNTLSADSIPSHSASKDMKQPSKSSKRWDSEKLPSRVTDSASTLAREAEELELTCSVLRKLRTEGSPQEQYITSHGEWWMMTHNNPGAGDSSANI